MNELNYPKPDTELSEDEQRYSIDIQTNDLLDQLLSDIPNYKRNEIVMNKIHK